MNNGSGWYLFGGVLITPASGILSNGGITKVSATGQFASLAAAQAYARSTWGGRTTYKFLGVGDSLPSELEDIFDNATHSEVLINGPYATQAAAQQALATGVAGPGTSTATSSGTDTQGPNVSGLTAIGQFFTHLGEANTWVRVAEVLVGLILITTGFARITGTQNFISAAAGAVIP